MEKGTRTGEELSAASINMENKSDPDCESPVCAGCGARISDRFYLLAADRRWHERCLKCSACHADLESELTCFSKHGDIYCKEDYYSRFSSQRCARCHLGISAAEIVMRARDLVYHLSCFSCATCNKVLFTGDHYGMRETSVYCRVHFEMMLQKECLKDLYYSDVAPIELNSTYNEGTPVRRGRARKRKHVDAADHGTYNSDVSDMGVELSERVSCQKSKRMRTSFKHHQLRSMQSFFTHNHNPDAKDLKELSQKTGLTKRVLQVWFQNARAKFRRNCLYEERVGVDNVSDNSTITSPSVPSPELSHGSLSPSSPNTNTGTFPSQHTHATQNTTPLAIHNVHSPISSECLYQ
ncbi:LIM/homeobox protein Lhx2a isoform X2 [Pimephales promelas]|uniref:LIM/homeobox protein Lhx2a isoform X2 n=1 Tax=Pimephales promelas TaxID=90988 RepID=UPI0019559F88|nr:LIM/homeobox protein Lhx2a isoform X2 [Pimephales promelas]